jgi:hypothetical protein
MAHQSNKAHMLREIHYVSWDERIKPESIHRRVLKRPLVVEGEPINIDKERKSFL